MNVRHAVALLAILFAAAPAVAWAAYPKRGTYIDVKLQAYLTTTKDAKALKSMTFPCQYKAGDGSTVTGGGIQILRKVKISSAGSVSYRGKAKVSESSSPQVVKDVTVNAKFANNRVKGTVTVKDSVCLPVTFNAKNFGVNPQG
ncbi:MAG: hypothetical protein ACEQSX_13945 [Baekduiaceae bacterium]